MKMRALVFTCLVGAASLLFFGGCTGHGQLAAPVISDIGVGQSVGDTGATGETPAAVPEPTPTPTSAPPPPPPPPTISPEGKACAPLELPGSPTIGCDYGVDALPGGTLPQPLLVIRPQRILGSGLWDQLKNETWAADFAQKLTDLAGGDLDQLSWGAGARDSLDHGYVYFESSVALTPAANCAGEDTVIDCGMDANGEQRVYFRDAADAPITAMAAGYPASVQYFIAFRAKIVAELKVPFATTPLDIIVKFQQTVDPMQACALACDDKVVTGVASGIVEPARQDLIAAMSVYASMCACGKTVAFVNMSMLLTPDVFIIDKLKALFGQQSYINPVCAGSCVISGARPPACAQGDPNCQSGSACCSKSTANQLCCSPPGSECSASSQCCSSGCIGGKCCTPTGQACSRNQDCCHGMCNNFLCGPAPEGASCITNDDCNQANGDQCIQGVTGNRSCQRTPQQCLGLNAACTQDAQARPCCAPNTCQQVPVSSNQAAWQCRPMIPQQ